MKKIKGSEENRFTPRNQIDLNEFRSFATQTLLHTHAQNFLQKRTDQHSIEFKSLIFAVSSGG